MRFVSNPRVYIYFVCALLAVVFISWHERVLARQQTAGKSAPVRHQSVVKPSEMLSADSTPRLYLFTEEPESTLTAELKAATDGKCSVLNIAGNDAEIREFFKIDQLPAAVLYDSANNEIMRLTGQFKNDELLDKLAAQLNK